MLDSSGISTEDLRRAVSDYPNIMGNACTYIYYSDCPDDNCCISVSTKKQHKAFRAELERREGMKNEIPELKAGMIVEYTSKEFGVLGLYLYINNDWGLELSGNGKQSFCYDISVTKIFNIGGQNSYSFNNIKNNLNLIWSRNPNQSKIEELEKTVREALKQIEELK